MSSSKVKKIAAILAILLAALMILPILVTVFTGQAAAAASQEELKKLKEEAAKLAREKDKIAVELRDIRKDKQSAIKEKKAIDAQISNLQEQVRNTTEMIQELSEQIAFKATELADAEADEQREYDLFKKRARAMEENRSASYWGVILKAESFSELLSRAEVINDIMEYDRLLLAELKTIREEIERTKAELEQSRQEQDQTKIQLEQQVGELEDKYQEQNEFIRRLEDNEGDYVKAYEEALAEMEKLNQEVKKMSAELAKKSKYVGGKYLWPVPGYYTVTSPFGNRWHPILRKYSFHSGTDVGAPSGTPVVAANTGTVIIAGWNNAYGNYIVINHGGGQTTLYAHLSKINVKKGASVSRGDKIGAVGSTGWSTGPHLHFEISIDGKNVNPMSYFK